MDGIHDMGGMQGFGPIDTSAVEPTHEAWETRMQVVAFVSGAVSRGSIEAIDPATYLSSSYHERWLLAGEQRGVATGRVDADALERWRQVFADDPVATPPRVEQPDDVERVQAMIERPFTLAPAVEARFGVGDRVRVKRMRPESHHRCPRYIRGAVGEIEKVVADDHLPGTRASDNQTETVYTVRFDSTELFGDRTAEGEPPYDLLIDQWERYLESADV